MYQTKGEGARIAKSYSAHDMVLIALCCRLESRHGLKRHSVSAVASAVAQALNQPGRVAKTAKLLLTFDPLMVEYSERTIEVTGDAVIIALEPVFVAVNEHLMPGQRPKQYELNLGLLELVPLKNASDVAYVEKLSSTKGREQA